MRRTILIICLAAGITAGAGLIGAQAQAQREQPSNETPAAEIPPDLVDMSMPDELRDYQVVLDGGDSPDQECVMMRGPDLVAGGMCLFDWRYDEWPTPLLSAAPLITGSGSEPGEVVESDERAAMLVIAPPNREFIVQTPLVEGRPSREVPVQPASAQIEVDGVQLEVHVFVADYSFDDEGEGPPDLEVVYK